MNYRHLFHAGGFSDVFKHVILIALLQALSRKENGFCVLDTHAGSGLYPLNLLALQKSKEYEEGIARIWQHKAANWPLPLQKFLEIVGAQGYPNFYPGSPLITAACLRPQDRLIAMELHPEEYQRLKLLFKNQSEITVHHEDGYRGIKAFLPPKEKRGLIFIDPAFEKGNDWEKMQESLALGLQRFAQGVFALWYPLKDMESVEKFKANIKNIMMNKLVNLSLEKILVSELWIEPRGREAEKKEKKEKKQHQRLIGCGMIIVNAPWQLEEMLKVCLPIVSSCLGESGGWSVDIG